MIGGNGTRSPARGRSAALAAALACVLAAALGAGTATAAPVLLTASYRPSERGKAIARSFLGVSTDWPGVLSSVTANGPSADPLYDQLIANLGAFGGGPPTLRVGGGLQDHAWWDASGGPPPMLGLEFPITPAKLDALAASVRATGQRLLLGINMAAGDVGLAVDEVTAMQQHLPAGSVLAYDIGNEPDGYPIRGLYTVQQGGRLVVHTMRSARTWNTAAYSRQFQSYATALNRVRPRPPLSATSGYGTLINPQQFLRRDHRFLRVYTNHNYVGSACNPQGVPYPSGSSKAPTIAKLLGNQGAFSTLAQNLRAVAYTRPYHLPYRITEWQSYTCGGKDGVSDAFAATLWGLDQLFLDAGVGLAGVDIHLDSPSYAPFVLSSQGGSRSGQVGALYYAMLTFAEATAHHAKLLPSVTTGEKPVRGANVHVWATRDPSGTLRFVVINKDLHRSGRVRIRVPGRHGPATILRLTAPGPAFRDQITLGGQGFGDQTTDGNITGQQVHETLAPRGGAYEVTVPRTSAALLTVSRR